MNNHFNFNKQALWPGLFKVIEETSELNIELSMIGMINGETKHWKGDLLPRVMEELADATAIIEWFREKNFTPEQQREIAFRVGQKKALYDQWYEIDDPVPEL